MYTIRKSTTEDIPVMQAIFAEAKKIMRADGNLLQWTGGYPSDELLLADIQKGHSHLVIDEDGRVIATFAFIIGVDPTYLKIYEGAWLEDTSTYGTIHRIASLPEAHGIARTVFDYAWSFVSNLRVDTHRDNKIMQHVVTDYGFQYCGIIYLRNGDERLAFQKI